MRRRRLTAVAGGAAVVGGGIAVVPTTPAGAATVAVTTGDDDGPGSLRQAVLSAASGDTITFDPSVTAITLTSGTITIDKDLTIQGPGAGGLTIDGSHASRIFTIDDGLVTASSVSITGVTLTNGYTGGGGGAIYTTEHLVVGNSVITGNATVGRGGGIYSTGDYLGVIGSTISGNSATDGAGGIRLIGGGAAVIDRSTVTGNTAPSSGGISVYDTGMTARDATITDSTISGNTATAGGGGGMNASGHVNVDVSRTTISGNTASANGGGIELSALGVSPKYYAQLALESSTIAANTGSSGGGVYIGISTAVIRTSTIASNTATYAGGGIAVGTFGQHSADLENTIVSDNVATISEPDARGTFAVDYSLIEDPTGATINGANNVTGVDPELTAPADNGGPTETMLPDRSSAAVDAGDPAFAPPPATDQRGEPRVVNDIIDMGAVELQPPPPPPDPGPVITGPVVAPRANPAVRRLAGPDAASTAAVISASTFAPGVPVAYLVSRTGASDAAAAGALGGPVLLVDRDAAPAATRVELARLQPTRIIVVGGTNAVGEDVVRELGAERIAGDDRYATAALLAEHARQAGVPVVYVVNGTSLADAVVAAAAGRIAGGPVLLVTPGAIPATTRRALAVLAPGRVIVIGGAVSDAVVDALGATRIAGVDRYTTAAAVAQSLPGDGVMVVRGESPIDAIAGGALAMKLLFVQRDAIPSPTDFALRTTAPHDITVLGGTASVSTDNEHRLAQYLPAVS